ncbi:MAG: phenylalanine--tRNA ligase subunit beta [Evtepia sp.]|uniref:phenylalanine--tRNA ligase subunit beta n=1 Tax=Evtepia sp. TaxID=2773933 RepID=UPI002A761644|nr:phenylalanine--tRNA ligase subunit beta [Evtepia sp.]MDY3013819.1 phenylalanine--tRNA ligase subunit beta [Evtepia sp.]
MLLSRKWLNEFVPVDANDRDFAEDMTLSGSKVEVTEVEGQEISNVVVGRVVEIKRHENSDHMWICQVDVGEDAPVQIVTGAQNVSAGDLVPVAKHNSTLPGGIHIKKGKLRGEESWGMLCSYKELGMADNDWPHSVVDGIFLLESDPELKAKGLKPGDDICQALDFNDHVVEFEITPNRPDCLSVIGLAREAAVTYGKELSLHEPVVKGGGPGVLTDLLDVETPADDLCPRYTARMVRNVKIGPSPKWLRERLRASGVRPINNIVDITNYVMLEYGQPMHAFDYRYVKGGKIIVRRAEDGETLTTLDGNQRNLNSSMLVIADETRAVGLAGIMGGENSEIVDDTVDVVFESANFNGACIRRTALSLGMRTEASAKFEKGLDIMNTLPAVNRACELVELLGAGEVLDGVIDILNFVPQPKQLKLRAEKINELLGTDIEAPEMCRILENLGFGVEGDTITVPSWRGDVEHYSDLAEEVARFFGYNQIPTTAMRGVTTQGGYSKEQILERNLGIVCRSMGCDEIITYSFISPTYYDKIRMPEDSPLRQSLKIMNPLGEDTSIMRTTVLPSMLEILSRNFNFRNKSARLYELGRTYFPREDGMADEPKILSLGMYGADETFFTLKGAVETVLSSIRAENITYETETTNPSYHPGRCAKVFVNGLEVGVFGQIHPLVADNYGVDAELYCAELKFDALMNSCGSDPEYKPLPKFPAVTRDIAVLVDTQVTVGALEGSIRAAAKGLLKEAALFDIYTGSNLPEGKKSVAFNLILRADDRSLTAQEADEEVKHILANLEKDFGAVLR